MYLAALATIHLYFLYICFTIAVAIVDIELVHFRGINMHFQNTVSMLYYDIVASYKNAYPQVCNGNICSITCHKLKSRSTHSKRSAKLKK